MRRDTADDVGRHVDRDVVRRRPVMSYADAT
jgi:hypothetical protein